MSPWVSLAIVWVAMALAMTAGWWWQRQRENAGIVDVIWAAGLAGSALVLAALGEGSALARTMLAVLGGLWGLRLALHLWKRVQGEPEDGRYRHLRNHWEGHQGKWFLLFQFQALLVVLFSLPFLAIAANPAQASYPWILLGLAIWLGSVTGEGVADRQLARFRSDPAHRGRTCRTGLWRYSRHPNYFFEWLHWFAYVALAAGSPLAWLAWLGPVVMYLFLRHVSGIPYTEAQALRSRGDDYRDYQQRTPMLFPWPPRRDDQLPDPPQKEST